MGTVILLNLANYAHWISFPAVAKKAAAYYDVTGKKSFLNTYLSIVVVRSAVDQDPNWIRIQKLFGSGSVFRIRIRIQTGEKG